MIGSENAENAVRIIGTDPAHMLYEQKLMLLLAERTRVYTHAGGSSVRVETAQELLRSIHYVISVYCRRCGFSEEQMRRGDPATAFAFGLKLVEQEFKQTRVLWEQLKKELITLGNNPLLDTVSGINNALAHYQFHDFAHRINDDIEYWLSDPVDETEQGITYLRLYIQQLRRENSFLAAFQQNTLYRFFTATRPTYIDLPLNMYEHAATAALGLCLLRRPPFSLRLDEKDLQQLYSLLAPLTPEQRSSLLHKCGAELCLHLQVNSAADLYCMNHMVDDLLPRLETALHGSHIDSIFPGRPH